MMRPTPIPVLTPTPAVLLGEEVLEVEQARILHQQLGEAIKLLDYHLARVRGGQATRGLSTPHKRRASRANGRKGGRPRKEKADA